MYLQPREIGVVIARVWGRLWLPVNPAPRDAERDREDALTAVVRLRGPWCGSIALSCSFDLVQTAAREELGGAEPGEAEIRAAFAKLTERVADELIAMRKAQYERSAAEVHRERHADLSAAPQLVSRFPFDCGGHVLTFELLEPLPAGKRAGRPRSV